MQEFGKVQTARYVYDGSIGILGRRDTPGSIDPAKAPRGGESNGKGNFLFGFHQQKGWVTVDERDGVDLYFCQRAPVVRIPTRQLRHFQVTPVLSLSLIHISEPTRPY